jgi:hypothetical protein
VAQQIKPGMSKSYYNMWVNGKVPSEATRLEFDRLGAEWLDRLEREKAAGDVVRNDIGWLDLDVSRDIWSALEWAYLYNDLNIVYGSPGLSKTMTAIEYSRKHGSWLVTLSETSGGLTSGLEEICETLGLALEHNRHDRRRLSREIQRKLIASGRSLIIDEAQYAEEPLIHELRTIWDKTRIGMVWIGNEKVYDQLAGGRKRAAFATVRSRISLRVRPKKPTEADVRKVLAGWGIESDGAVKWAQHLVGKDAIGALRDLRNTIRVAIAHRGSAAEVNEADLRLAWKNRGMEAA